MSAHHRRAFALLLTSVSLLMTPPRAFAQAPPTGPLILHVPSSARTAALGNAWVAGRDGDVIFHNPAQLIGQRPGLDVSITRLGPSSTAASVGSVFAAGKWSLTFGWGAQVLGFNAEGATSYPFSADTLSSRGPRSGSGALLTVGGAFVLKGFRIGAAGKYVSEFASPGLVVGQVDRHKLLADVGVARNLFGGAAALAVQNIGRDSTRGGHTLTLPRQVSMGWSRTKQAGPLDLGVFSQVSLRKDWTAPAGGLEVGYSWLDGYNIELRVGARRPETEAEKPVALGAAFTVDRLTVEYAVRFFDDGRTINGVTVRWR